MLAIFGWNPEVPWGRGGWRRILRWLAMAGLAFTAICLLVGWRLSAPVRSSPGPIPSDLPIEPVSFPSASGSTIQAWYLQGRTGGGAILLLHGVRANRTANLTRARFLWKTGYTVLFLDFQAHGASPGKRITFGYLESRDVRAAVAYLRFRLPAERLGAVGTSMGGAALLLGPQPVGLDAVVLESVYPTVEEAVRNRVHTYLGPLSGALSPLLLVQMRLRLGFPPSALRPIDGIARLGAPVLVVAGTADRSTTVAETRRVFSAAHPPKELWLIPGAGHVDLYAHAPAEYERRILSFFNLHLRAPRAQEDASSSLPRPYAIRSLPSKESSNGPS
jgi:fermentation-respiration switch protein FrsA (DUF1100 family)